MPGGSNVAITLNVDGNTNYTAIQGSAFVQTDDEDWDLWIPAMRYINVSVATGAGGAGGATPIRLRTDWVSMSEILAVLFGRVKKRSDLADPTVFDMAIAGMAA